MTQYTLTSAEDLVTVVTGCDSGFGTEIHQLGGYTIYATCLTKNIGGHFDLTAKDANYMGIIRITKGLLPSLRTYA
ncbi:hypothetical protein BGZ47_002866, partial [Haplosporangium gracile]